MEKLTNPGKHLYELEGKAFKLTISGMENPHHLILIFTNKPPPPPLSPSKVNIDNKVCIIFFIIPQLSNPGSPCASLLIDDVSQMRQQTAVS